MRKLVCLITAAVCIAFSLVTACAEGSVRYEGGAKAFVFTPGSEQSPTDLFGSFRSVMPGDTLFDTLRISTKLPAGKKVKLYLQAEGIDRETPAGFLRQLQLRLEKDTGGLVFEGTLDSATGPVYLGSFGNGDELILNMTLYAPLTMGNVHQDAVGQLRWVFLAEQSDGTGPKTGDGAPVELLIGTMAASLAGICVILYRLRRRTEA